LNANGGALNVEYDTFLVTLFYFFCFLLFCFNLHIVLICLILYCANIDNSLPEDLILYLFGHVTLLPWNLFSVYFVCLMK